MHVIASGPAAAPGTQLILQCEELLKLVRK